MLQERHKACTDLAGGNLSSPYKYRPMTYKIFLALIGSAALAASAHSQVILTQFTFETSVPTTAGPYSADVSNTATTSMVLGSHAGTSSYTSPSGNGSAKSFSSTNWAVGDYYQFSVDTSGFTGGIDLTLGAMSSNTGPSSFSLQYSTTGATGAFATFATYTVANDGWSPTAGKIPSEHEFDLSSISALSNNANAVFRLVDASTVAVTGGTVASTGTSRVDDFYVSTGGYVIPASVPEPSTCALAACGIVLVGAVRRLRSRTVV